MSRLEPTSKQSRWKVELGLSGLHRQSQLPLVATMLRSVQYLRRGKLVRPVGESLEEEVDRDTHDADDGWSDREA